MSSSEYNGIDVVDEAGVVNAVDFGSVDYGRVPATGEVNHEALTLVIENTNTSGATLFLTLSISGKAGEYCFNAPGVDGYPNDDFEPCQTLSTLEIDPTSPPTKTQEVFLTPKHYGKKRKKLST